jgi:hypothetical protein
LSEPRAGRCLRAGVLAGAALAVTATAHTALNATRLRRPTARPRPVAAAVSVLIPARDEAERIVDCLAAVRAQRGVDRLEVIVLDDGSSDVTAQLASSVPGVRVVTGAALPPGWLGKPHACQQLADLAAADSEILIFLDADVRLAAHAVAASVQLLLGAELDFASPYPRQLAVSGAERLIQPLLQWSWLTLLPLRASEHHPRESLAVANGQFLLVRRDVYVANGGHAAVRGAVLDDIALARSLRRGGARGGMVDGSSLASCRMYAGWAEVREGYGKSLWTAFGSPAGATGVIAALAVAYVLPAAAALAGSRIGMIGYGAGVLGRAITARATGGRAWPDPLSQPASIGVLAYLTARSLHRSRRGELRWRGRTIPSVT